MKKKKVGYGFLLFASIILISGCGKASNAETPEKKSIASEQAVEKVIVGSVGSDADIWTFIAKSEAAKEAGIEIEVKNITGGPITNAATVDGDVDANAFQSIGYLESFNESSPDKLVPIATTYVEPLGIYSEKFESVEDIAEGSTIALADNPSNTTRGLRLLETAGLIKLKADFDDGIGTPDDIIENPKSLKFTLIDDLTGPRILPDVDVVLISNTIALEGGLNVLKDSIFHEEADTALRATINVIVTKEGRENEAALQKLGELYHSPEVQAYIEETFDGTKVEVKESIETIWGE